MLKQALAPLEKLPQRSQTEQDWDSSSGLIQGLPCPAAVWHRNGELIALNAAAQDLTQCGRLDISDQERWIKRVHTQDRSRYQAAREALQNRNQRTICDYRFVPKDKRIAVWLREEAVPYLAKETGGTSTLSVYTDISDLKSSKRKAGMAKGLESLEAELIGIPSTAAVMGGFVHEVQNSLQGIGMGLDLLQLAQADPIECQTVTHALERTSRSLQEIRELFQPPEPVLSTQDPRLILAEVAQQVESAWPDQDIQWHIVCQESLPSLAFEWQYFRHNWERLLSFFYALLSDGGEIGTHVKLRKIDAQRYIELRVQINAKAPLTIQEEQIWQPFLRLKGYPVGLSLVLVRQMLNRQNGKITFRKKNQTQAILTVLLKVPTESANPIPAGSRILWWRRP